MGRRRPFTEFSLLMAAVLSGTACAPRNPHSEVSIPGVIGAPPGVVTGTEHVENVSVDPAVAGRVRGLEQQLATQDRRIAAVRSEMDAARAGVPAQPAIPDRGAREQNVPPTPQDVRPAPQTAAPVSAAPQPQPALPPIAAIPAGAMPPSPPSAPMSPSAAPSQGSTGATSSGTAAPSPPAIADKGTAAQPSGSTADPRLAGAQRRIARLERMLASEVKRRHEVEAEMDRLLQETSAGPYEQSTSVVEKHLREQLDRARKEIAGLRNTLASERRSRDDVERRFAALQVQLQSAAAGDAPVPAARREEVEALKERQRRVLASIQQELAASKQRETELRQTIETAQGANGVSLADTVSGLRTENSALQLRLDEEHQRNANLNAKLQLAQRVTELIFRMQQNGTQPVAATALPAAP
jgi:hypothetical protein